MTVRLAEEPVDQPLGDRGGRGGDVGGDIVGQLDCRWQHLVALDCAAGQAHLGCLLSGEQPTGQEKLHRPRDPDQPRDDLQGVRLRDHASPVEDEAELRLPGHDPDVPLHGQRDADADCRAVDCGDDRRGHLPWADRVSGPLLLNRLALVALTAPECAPSAFKVGADAEVATGAGDHNGADRFVGFELAEGPMELESHLPGVGVASLGPVQYDQAHATSPLYENRFVHGRSHSLLSCSIRPAAASGRTYSPDGLVLYGGASMAENCVQVVTTTDSREKADRLASSAVESRLAACAQVI